MVNDIVLEVLLAGTPDCLEAAIAWMLYEFKKQIQISVSNQQLKHSIYSSINQKKMSSGIRTLRKKIVQKEKIQKK